MNVRIEILFKQSVLVTQPVVIGFLRPALLVPASFFSQIAPDEIEAIILHELAHIRRHDYLVNLLQTFTEAVFFFNPGLLWLSSLIRKEREHCCDHFAVERTGDKKTFVRALVSIHELPLRRSKQFVAFAASKSFLLQRVEHIFHAPKTLTWLGKISMSIPALLLFSLLIFLGQIPQTNSRGLSSRETPAQENPAISFQVPTSLAVAPGASTKTRRKKNLNQPGYSSYETVVHKNASKEFIDGFMTGVALGKKLQHREADESMVQKEVKARHQLPDQTKDDQKIVTTITDQKGVTIVQSSIHDKKKLEEDLIRSQKRNGPADQR
jgi:hypothetical protein